MQAPVEIDTLVTATNLGAAVLLGSLIGLERQWRQRLAGLRTNALVALGAATFVVFESLFTTGDPTRVAAQVVTGIGFLGAGIIFREGASIHGLNTAATLWCSAAVGVLAGAGAFKAALIATVFVVIVNLLLRTVVKKINDKVEHQYSHDPSSRAFHEDKLPEDQ
jgi:putative Mg2+ transporter-C (MgtC) family protein